ncbi:putative restriction methylase [Escherichia coli]|uniref:Putative restriction methylase n=1 Tax=Escherichia coli TaxID=562 RepID=A0A2X3LRK5_ECOLX|nr:putative restriction methylase [Escherichia coli]
MSDITASRPEVVNGHTDVICSTSIRHILAVRKSSLPANRHTYPATG